MIWWNCPDRSNSKSAEIRRMHKKLRRSRKKKATPGAKPDVLKLDENWEEAVKKSLKKKKPPEGWPK